MIWLIIHSGCLLIMAYFIRDKKLPWIFWGGLSFKLLMGIVIGCYYFYWVEGGDTVAFHEKARSLYSLARNNLNEYFTALVNSDYHIYKGEARTELFSKITSVIYLLSGGNYWVSSLYFSFISFLSSWFLLSQIRTYYPQIFYPAVFALLFIPSTIWASGVLKDSLANASLFFLAGILIKSNHRVNFNFSEYAVTLLALALLFYLKPYLFGLSVIFMTTQTWLKTISILIKTTFVRRLVNLLVVVLLFLMGTLVNPKFNLDQLPETIYQNHEVIYQNALGPKIHFHDIEANWVSLTLNIPEALFAGLFRPFIWEVPAPYLPFALESMLIIGMSLFTLYHMRKIHWNNLTLYCIAFCIILAIMLPMVSPGFGSLIRYKAAYQPFLMLLLSIIPFQLLSDKRPIH